MATNYGRHFSLQHIDFGFIAPGQMRGCTYDKTSKNMWAYQLGVWGGRDTDESSANVTTRVAVYATSSMHPTSRLGYSAAMTVTAAMTTWDGGASYSAAVESSTGPANNGIPLYAGNQYTIAVLGTGGYLGHGMQAAARISATDRNFYDRTGLSQPPPASYGGYNQHYEGHIVAWAVCEDNVAPDKPTGLSPAGTILDTAPAFSVPFVDANSDRGDQLNQFRIQVRRKSDSASMWNTTLTATNGEKNAKAFARAYAGSTLSRGTTYQWRTQVSDYFGTWSDWSNWTDFTPSALGLVTLDGNPTGKITSNQPSFQGKWTHQTSTSMKRVQVRLWNGSGNTILQTGANYDIADVASSAAPGTPFTVAWANAGLSTLSWGTDYQYDIRGYDGTQWSDWSAKRSFRTNAAPLVPSDLRPGGNAPFGSRPVLSCKTSDPDNTPANGLTAYARIKDASGTVLQTRQMPYNASSGRFEYQTTSGDLAGYATYRWDAYSYDGSLYSGEASSAASAAKSGEQTFQYAAVPDVTVTGPSSPVSTATPIVLWTVSAQTRYQVRGYDPLTSELVYDSGSIASTSSRIHVMTTGGMLRPWRNGETIDLVVSVQDSSGLWGDSAVWSVQLQYPTPDALTNVDATPIIVGTDIWESAIRVTWDQTLYGAEWQGYTIWRTCRGVSTRVFRATSPTSTVFIDYFVPSGDDATYAVTQDILQGIDVLTSDPVEAIARLDLGGVVLCSVSDPETIRTTLRYTSERDYGRKIDETPYYPLSGANPTTLRARTRVLQPTFDIQIFDDNRVDAATRRDELDAVDASGDTLCYRDNHGRRLFVTMPDCTITDQVPDWYTGTVDLREERYSDEVPE